MKYYDDKEFSEIYEELKEYADHVEECEIGYWQAMHLSGLFEETVKIIDGLIKELEEKDKEISAIKETPTDASGYKFDGSGMIIRLSLDDNDYGILMDSFVRSLPERITRIPENVEWLGSEKQSDIIKDIRKTDKLLNPNVTENHTEEEKDFLRKRITDAFVEFAYATSDAEIAKYLEKSFHVEIVESMEDKCENGEAWYWFQHSRAYLNQ